MVQAVDESRYGRIVWPYTAKLTNVIVTSFGESSNLVRESKMFVKDEAKVSSRVEGVE